MTEDQISHYGIALLSRNLWHLSSQTDQSQAESGFAVEDQAVFLWAKSLQHAQLSIKPFMVAEPGRTAAMLARKRFSACKVCSAVTARDASYRLGAAIGVRG